jgi:adenylylsulfate kinase-like enzyme
MANIIWLTGQPNSGKTTIAKEFLKYNPNWFHIDGDDIREIYQNFDYSREGRLKNIQAAQQIAEYLFRKGEDVIVSLVSPYIEQREQFKNKIGHGKIVEAYIHTTEERERDSFRVPDYEPPRTNFVSIDTTNVEIKESLISLIEYASHKLG